MATSSLLLLLSLTTTLLLVPAATAQSAPAPGPSGPINITAILEKAGQYTFFIRLLNETQASIQITNQLNNSHDGLTVFAPTDNAFNTLPSGTLNNLTFQQHVQLVQYHICPKYYSLDDFQTVSNPVQTQAGGGFGLNFTTQGNQVNVSTGIVSVPVNNAVSKSFPLAVYQVDKVLLPAKFYEAPSPVPAPPADDGGSGGRPSGGGAARAPSAVNPGNGAGSMGKGLGLVSAIWLLCMGLFM